MTLLHFRRTIEHHVESIDLRDLVPAFKGTMSGGQS